MSIDNELIGDEFVGDEFIEDGLIDDADIADDERRALLVEDDTFSRSLLRSFLETLGYQVHAVGSANEAIEDIEVFDPDIAVVDLELGEGPSGVDVVVALRRLVPWCAAILLSSHRSIELVHAHPNLPQTNFAFAIKGELTSVDILRSMIDTVIDGGTQYPQDDDSVAELTAGQAELLRFIAGGMTNDEIAKTKQVSFKSVERMIARLYRSIGVPSRPGANARVEATLMYRDGQVTVR